MAERALGDAVEDQKSDAKEAVGLLGWWPAPVGEGGKALQRALQECLHQGGGAQENRSLAEFLVTEEEDEEDADSDSGESASGAAEDRRTAETSSSDFSDVVFGPSASPVMGVPSFLALAGVGHSDTRHFFHPVMYPFLSEAARKKADAKCNEVHKELGSFIPSPPSSSCPPFYLSLSFPLFSLFSLFSLFRFSCISLFSSFHPFLFSFSFILHPEFLSPTPSLSSLLLS